MRDEAIETAEAIWNGLRPHTEVLKESATVVAGPLVKLAVGRASGRPEYLRALQILPGRIEFSYLPEETQALLILPTAAGAGGGAVIVGADRQRAFGEDAVRRCAAIATEIVGDALC